VLRLDGIIVTHRSRVSGCGVNVTSGGTLILASGMIFNNTVSEGGGVANYGNFTMIGGAVSNNTAAVGGGVANYGNFTMSGGEFFGNRHCGVFNAGNFTMSRGKIFNNLGSGVVIDYNGNFSMTGGEIYRNAADIGGGVYISSSYGIGTFTMSGGMIFNNTATEMGGGVYNEGSIFRLSSGTISNNTANTGGGMYANGGNFSMTGGTLSNNTAASGGGVYAHHSNVVMSNGELFNNTARNNGGGAYIFGGNFSMTGGKISNNTAGGNGGGIGVPLFGGLEYVYVYNGAVFANNRASASYNRNSAHDSIYEARIGRSVTWTSPFNQGYNNYDISYTNSTQSPGGPTSSPSHSTPGSTNTPNPGNTPGPSDEPGLSATVVNLLRIAIIVAIVTGLIVAVMYFYMSKKKAPAVAKDWIDSTDATVA